MAQMSVEQFANELGLLPAVLLEQLKAAGVKKMLAEDSLTEQDKAQLLDYLRKTHGTTETRSKVTLTRRQTSEIRNLTAQAGHGRFKWKSEKDAC
jgi:translation initiation factor IF-2